jgi:hypothetical protein
METSWRSGRGHAGAAYTATTQRCVIPMSVPQSNILPALEIDALQLR